MPETLCLHRMAECLHRMTEYLHRMAEYLHRMAEYLHRMTEYLYRMAECLHRMTDNLLIKLHEFFSTFGARFLTSFSGPYSIKIYTKMVHKRPLYGDTI
jgi:hypothetical protein